MTPAEQFQYLQQDTSGLDDLLKPERMAVVLGAVGGLLMAASGKGVIRGAGIVLTLGSLYYGIVGTQKTA